ncbi:hypothetical protein [Bilophila wadsworthia]|uniref:hypothetical protein n=2 Tax=Bilophila wadsworthia TaxID=35833 RepID=UPI0027B9548B|nr:hypothetical protein [Bilophila wadsworthia]
MLVFGVGVKFSCFIFKKIEYVNLFSIFLVLRNMKLFERIRYISTTQGIPLYRIAEYLGESPSKFNQWLNEKSQKNIWEHLPKIIELFPNIRREWLYMGDEPMLKDGSTSSEPSHIAAAPEQRLATEDQMIQLERENAQLRELLEAKNELLASKDKIIALHEENKRLAESVSAVVTPTETRRDNPQHATSDRPASGATDCGM